jgi:putative endonuclease
MQFTHRKTGQRAERQAIKFLRAQGLKLIRKNFYSRYGEIDIIMRSQHNIIFAEVKMRSSNTFGSPIEYVTLSKQKKIINTAQVFLLKHTKYTCLQPRFDVIGITPSKTIWIKNAFTSNY